MHAGSPLQVPSGLRPGPMQKGCLGSCVWHMQITYHLEPSTVCHQRRETTVLPQSCCSLALERSGAVLELNHD